MKTNLTDHADSRGMLTEEMQAKQASGISSVNSTNGESDHADSRGMLWGGRFEEFMERDTADYNESLSFDRIMYEYDIMGSEAHVRMLAQQGIVSAADRDLILKGLAAVREKIAKGQIEFDIMDEDIMMTVEKNLIEEIGETGKRLHTARSRNDQNVVDEKLYLKDMTRTTMRRLTDLLNVLLVKAEEGRERIMPGFTHLQHAQPITQGFYFMAHFQGLRRDLERFLDSWKRLDQNPLGACALAGTTLPTDRSRTTELLKFAGTTENALDTVGDRDFIAEYIFNAALCMTHLSGFAEELVVFCSQEFSFVHMDDSFSTGSSIMPQKKNPDLAELVRGKAGRMLGNLTTILAVLKGTFLTLNKDYQEDKEPLFDSVHTINRSINIMARMLEHTHFRDDVLAEQVKKGFINATDVAEFLVVGGMPFRDAHEVVGSAVKYCEHERKDLEQLTSEELAQLGFPAEIKDLKQFSVRRCVEKRVSYGGTAPVEVERQIRVGRTFLEEKTAEVEALSGLWAVN